MEVKVDLVKRMLQYYNFLDIELESLGWPNAVAIMRTKRDTCDTQYHLVYVKKVNHNDVVEAKWLVAKKMYQMGWQRFCTCDVLPFPEIAAMSLPEFRKFIRQAQDPKSNKDKKRMTDTEFEKAKSYLKSDAIKRMLVKLYKEQND